jgi:hypothetical protein
MDACKHLNLGVVAKCGSRTCSSGRICKIGVKRTGVKPYQPPTILLNHSGWQSNTFIEIEALWRRLSRQPRSEGS